MFDGYYDGKTVLVSGLAGAKGTWLGWYLLHAGVARIIGVDNARSLDGTCFWLSGLGDDPRVSLHSVDVRDLQALQNLIRRERPHAAVHLAAVAIVGECRQRPLQCYSVNTLGVATLLEAMRTTDLERAVVVTTDKVYRDKRGEPWVEGDPLMASGPYAVSKACADMIAQDYLRTYLLPAGKHGAIARAGNVVSPGDHHMDRLFVSIVQSLSRGEPPVILNPDFTRPYAFVGDIVSGYLALLAASDQPAIDGEAFNFGPREARGVRNAEIATRMCELWGGDIAWQRGEPRPEPFQYQSLDCSKAHRLLGWRPAYRLDDALTAVIEWHKAYSTHPGPGQMREVTERMVAQHAAAARQQGIPWAQPRSS